MKWLLQRLAEPSTGAAISGLAGTIGSMIYTGLPLSAALPAIIGGLAGIVLKEKARQ